MTSSFRSVVGAALIVVASAVPARADFTAFVGVNSAPDARPARGLALGAGLLIGFEFEYSDTSEDTDSQAPSLRSGMGNVYVQNPIPIAGLTFYGTVGAGLYRERIEDVRSETNVGVNMGGGVKVTLAGPLRLRLDYRVFTLQGDPIESNFQRFYAGLNLAF